MNRKRGDLHRETAMILRTLSSPFYLWWQQIIVNTYNNRTTTQLIIQTVNCCLHNKIIILHEFHSCTPHSSWYCIFLHVYAYFQKKKQIFFVWKRYSIYLNIITSTYNIINFAETPTAPHTKQTRTHTTPTNRWNLLTILVYMYQCISVYKEYNIYQNISTPKGNMYIKVDIIFILWQNMLMYIGKYRVNIYAQNVYTKQHKLLLFFVEAEFKTSVLPLWTLND